MGLLDMFKPKAKAKSNSSVRLPYAEPGIQTTGSHYFEENIAKVPPGRPELQLIAAPDADWGKIQVFWEGLRIGNLSLDEQQERVMLNALSQLGTTGTVFTVQGETREERAMDLNVKDSQLKARTRVRALIPRPQRLQEWVKTPVEHRGNLKLSEPTTVKIRLKGQGAVQSALGALTGGKDDYIGSATITVGTEPSGKYKGNPSLTLMAGNAVVGTVGGRYLAEEPELFKAVESGLKNVQLVIRRSSFGDNEWYSTIEFKAEQQS
jgi:hypothetical protein